MRGLQRDHAANERWTNHEGYNDSTAGAAISNVMREQRMKQTKAVERKPSKSSASAKPRPAPRKEPAPVHPVMRTAPPNDQALLKVARTLFTICTMICRLQNFAIDEITIRDKASGTVWSKRDLEAPQP